MAALCSGDVERDGRLMIRIRPDGLHEIVVTRLRPVHPDLRGKPVIHLDATLRPEIARTILPRLEVEEIAAEVPHMPLTLVTGSFGKGPLCPDGGQAPRSRRRANRLRECVDYVRWHARRVSPGKSWSSPTRNRGGLPRHARRRGRALQRHRRPRPLSRRRG